MANFDELYEEALDPKKKESSKFDELYDEAISQRSSKKRSAISAPIKGLLKGVKDLTSLPFIGASFGPVSRGSEAILERELPTLEEHSGLERAGRLAPSVLLGPEGIGLKALQLAAATAAGEIAKQGGLGESGQSITEAAAMGIPGLAKGGINKLSNVFKGEVEKLPSGLTKIKALESKRPKLATISKEREALTIDKLNKEASLLAKKTIRRNIPLVDALEKGVDIDKNLKLGFQNLKTAAEKANPTIDVKPLTNFLKSSIEKYKGIPRPHPEARKIIQEVSAFKKNPTNSLKDLLRTYRSNNKKVSHIYETSRISGRQQEFVDFLLDQNKSIAESFEKTLPSDSSWLKEFKKLNFDYKDLQNTRKVQNQLKGVLSSKPTAAEIDRLATDPRIQKRIELSLGEKGSQEIIEIAKDLKKSREALKNIPRSEWKKFDNIFPLFLLFPGIGKLYGAVKAVKLSRYAYGRLLSSPEKRKAYSNAIRSLIRDDLDGFKKSASVLKSSDEQ